MSTIQVCVHYKKKKVVGLEAKGLVYTNKSSPPINTTIHISNFIIC